LPQIKRRPSEALPELFRPLTPITSFDGPQAQGSTAGLSSLESGLSHLEVDDWDF
jgi:STE20-related kinase adapter protein alpha